MQGMQSWGWIPVRRKGDNEARPLASEKRPWDFPLLANGPHLYSWRPRPRCWLIRAAQCEWPMWINVWGKSFYLCPGIRLNGRAITLNEDCPKRRKVDERMPEIDLSRNIFVGKQPIPFLGGFSHADFESDFLIFLFEMLCRCREGWSWHALVRFETENIAQDGGRSIGDFWGKLFTPLFTFLSLLICVLYLMKAE